MTSVTKYHVFTGDVESMSRDEALAIVLEAAGFRAEQWQDKADYGLAELPAEFCEADDDEAREISDRINRAIEVLRNA